MTEPQSPSAPALGGAARLRPADTPRRRRATPRSEHLARRRRRPERRAELKSPLRRPRRRRRRRRAAPRRTTPRSVQLRDLVDATTFGRDPTPRGLGRNWARAPTQARARRHGAQGCAPSACANKPLRCARANTRARADRDGAGRGPRARTRGLLLDSRRMPRRLAPLLCAARARRARRPGARARGDDAGHPRTSTTRCAPSSAPRWTSNAHRTEIVNVAVRRVCRSVPSPLARGACSRRRCPTRPA